MKDVLRISWATVILAAGMIISASVLSKFLVNVQHEKSITVKGFAEKRVTSDVGKFSCTYRRRAGSLQVAYSQLEQSKAVVLEYLENKGFADSDLIIGTIKTSKVYKRDTKGEKTNEVDSYDVAQSIFVKSPNVERIERVSLGITELIKDGIEISASAPRFYVSDLEQTKVRLLARATSDGHGRALTLAENSGGKLGALISARQGVFQITEPNSTRTSSYGIYDTSTIDKAVKAVVTLEYAIEP